jgi:hypothetical protein
MGQENKEGAKLDKGVLESLSERWNLSKVLTCTQEPVTWTSQAKRPACAKIQAANTSNMFREKQESQGWSKIGNLFITIFWGKGYKF